MARACWMGMLLTVIACGDDGGPLPVFDDPAKAARIPACAVRFAGSDMVAWVGRDHDGFQLSDVKTSAGAALGLDSALGFTLPLQAELVVAHGFQEKGDTRVYFRFGVSF